MGTEVVVSRLPYCDFCQEQGVARLARYDGATQMRVWANMCEEHFQQYGVGLGTGRGQRLLLKEEKEMRKRLNGLGCLCGAGTINDEERRDWVNNDEGLYDLKRISRLSIREFIRQNRALIDTVIESVKSGENQAHYLKYDRSFNGFGDDPTEATRRRLVTEINAEQGSRAALEAEYGQVWNTDELQRDFKVLGFMAPYVHVRRRSDNAEGSVMFQADPRFYFGFQLHKD